jgi:hypothetical protein
MFNFTFTLISSFFFLWKEVLLKMEEVFGGKKKENSIKE